MSFLKIKAFFKELIITLLLFALISFGVNYLRAPDLSLQPRSMHLELIDGQEIDLFSDTKPTVIHFWGKWCPVCRLEAPNIEAIKDQVHLVTIAVKSGSDAEIQAFMQEHGYDFPVYNDTKGSLAERFDISVYPSTFIYDRNGTLRFTEVGYSTTFGLKARIGLVK